MSRQHPQTAQIRALLDAGRNDAHIAEQLDVNVRVVREVRREAGLPPAPRAAWRRRPHPKAQTIRVLLAEGHTDAAIREETGADLRTIARLRHEGGFGKATITRRRGRPHPKDAQIRELLKTGLSSAEVARRLHADPAAVRRIRAAARIPLPARRTLEEKWAANTRPLEGGHLEWTGERVGTSRSPIMRYREQLYSPGAIAFRMRTGRHAVGRVQAECGVHQCVAPACVEDQPGRKARRDADRRADRAYRVIFGETAG